MENKKIKTYSESGVDIERGDRLVDYIKRIKSPAMQGTIGGFAGGIDISSLKNYDQPLLLSATDGVGTKLLVAKELNDYSGVGIDLVAMSVNDLLACGAMPLVFLDYIACNRIEEDKLQKVIESVVKGCEIAGCVLAGGETAEMPDLYAPGEIDLAGFATGIVEKAKGLPLSHKMKAGDVIFGLPSDGVHSNGFSLARNVVPKEDKASWQEMLVPTRIYRRECEALLKTGVITGIAHITGGGLEGNINRLFPENLSCRLNYQWEVLDIFKKIQAYGNIEDSEMRKVFNLGIGMAMIVPQDQQQIFMDTANSNSIRFTKIGEVITKPL
ncbi:MAG: phosphoribosylformylglycinamidine cyclo-ligase [Spirochaetales bacterium]|nr:phosphoribosylformylglycinamidine cyclo-ligase [Spirochaetales bacterium]